MRIGARLRRIWSPSAPKQREPNDVVSARRSERAVGLRGTFGERKYLKGRWLSARVRRMGWGCRGEGGAEQDPGPVSGAWKGRKRMEEGTTA